MSPDAPTRSAAPWWHGKVGYEIYIRSFADGSGDGIGDLLGVAERLDHLVWLGIDALWITPFYPSPGFDHGYDISDFCAVDPAHGTLDDFDALVERAHALGLRVITDIVPNHTSHLHPWFVDSSRGRHSAHRDYYVWRDPAPGGGPPNNWVSHFGGSAWTLDETSGQYYMHLFLAEQPDLNWSNETVREEFDGILRFWLDRGVDGFRIDVAQGLMKDPLFRDNPQIREIAPGAGNWASFNAFDHVFDMDRPETLDVYRRWHRLAEPRGAVLIGEVGITDPVRLTSYVAGGDALDAVFLLEPGWMSWEPAALLSKIRKMHREAPSRASWVLDNHDQSRSTSRFGGGDRGSRRSLALMTLLCGLGGMPFLYQGQELGLEDGLIERADLVDPIALLNEGAPGRDRARTAMPWAPGTGNGFTTGLPWLPAEDRPPGDTVQVQRLQVGSWLGRHHHLLEVRRRLPDLWSVAPEWIATGSDQVAALSWPETFLVANLSPGTHRVPLPAGDWMVVFSTVDRPADEPVGGEVTVPDEATVILIRT